MEFTCPVTPDNQSIANSALKNHQYSFTFYFGVTDGTQVYTLLTMPQVVLSADAVRRSGVDGQPATVTFRGQLGAPSATQKEAIFGRAHAKLP